jgi:hypothetical protein
VDLPVFCNRSDLPREEQERQRSFIRELLRTALERKNLENGLSFRFPAEALVAVAELMAIERRCCSFLEIRLEANASEPWVSLTLEGPPGTRAVLESELQLLS